MSDTEDRFLNSSSRPLPPQALSLQSYEGDDNLASQNLLEDVSEPRGANPAHEEAHVTFTLMRGVKRTNVKYRSR